MHFIYHCFTHFIAEKDSEDVACSVLFWKFDYYDVNQDGELQANEWYKFIKEVHELINFAEFEEQMMAKIDTNQDKVIQFSEWFTYFTADVTEGKIIFVYTFCKCISKPLFVVHSIINQFKVPKITSYLNVFSLQEGVHGHVAHPQKQDETVKLVLTLLQYRNGNLQKCHYSKTLLHGILLWLHLFIKYVHKNSERSYIYLYIDRVYYFERGRSIVSYYFILFNSKSLSIYFHNTLASSLKVPKLSTILFLLHQ